MDADARGGLPGRRAFIRRAVALGLTAAAIGEALAACRAAAPTPSPVAAPATASAARPAATASAARPAVTAATPRAATGSPSPPARPRVGASPTDGDQGVGIASAGPFGAGGGLGPGPARPGGGGTLKVLAWQAPTILNPHLSQGINNLDIARLCYEPLADFDATDRLVPWLATAIPSPADGEVAADRRSVVWRLRPGVRWSDGAPFTAEDVVFTWRYASEPATAAISRGAFDAVALVEAPDELTVKIIFKEPTPGWYIPFTGPRGLIIPAHIFRAGSGAAARTFPANLAPVGTGPYRAVAFAPGDLGTFERNPYWRDAGGPHFDRVEWKGGGDAVSAARAVLQTGEYHLATNLQVEAAVLNQIVGGAAARLGQKPAFAVELLYPNFTDPNREVDGERSSVQAPHPSLADMAVRRALALAVDRATIAGTLYGPAGAPTAALLAAPAALVPPDLPQVFDLAEAGRLLDAAGWAREGRYRAKGGVPLAAVIQTTVNPVRQKTQQILKDALETLGVRVELKSVDAAVFLSADPGNPDTATRFQADLEIYANGPDSPDVQPYLGQWTTAQVPSKANGWGTLNLSRYRNPAYDALLAAARAELDPARRQRYLLDAQRLLRDEVATIGMVARKTPFAHAAGIAGIAPTAWAPITWNLANWTGA